MGWLGQRLFLVVAVGVALVPMYYLFPDEEDMALIEALPGVAITAVGLVAAESLFQLYVQYSSASAQNSLLAGIIVLMTWLYVSGLLILVGAAVNAVLSNRSEDVSIRPSWAASRSRKTVRNRRPAANPPINPGDRRPSRAPPNGNRRRSRRRWGVRAALPPDRIDTDRRKTVIPFVDDTVSIGLHWNVRDSESDSEAADPRE